MKKAIIVIMAGLLSLPALADLDHNKEYGLHDEVMRGTTFPIQDITEYQTTDLLGTKKLKPYSREVVEAAVLDCQKNNHYLAYNGKPHPSNRTNLSYARGQICAFFEVKLDHLNHKKSY
jgi:hypothetical protein